MTNEAESVEQIVKEAALAVTGLAQKFLLAALALAPEGLPRGAADIAIRITTDELATCEIVARVLEMAMADDLDGLSLQRGPGYFEVRFAPPERERIT